MRSISISGHAPTARSGADAPKIMSQSPPRSPRPKTAAWVDTGSEAGSPMSNTAQIHRRPRLSRSRRYLTLAACILCTIPFRSHAQAPGLGASVELVDPKLLRVCADPRSMPFSDEAGEGFEDKLAQMLAAKLGKAVSYTYFPRATGFVRATLNALKCDVIMGDSQG